MRELVSLPISQELLDPAPNQLLSDVGTDSSSHGTEAGSSTH